jgi:hypothetical protein
VRFLPRWGGRGDNAATSELRRLIALENDAKQSLFLPIQSGLSSRTENSNSVALGGKIKRREKE